MTREKIEALEFALNKKHAEMETQQYELSIMEDIMARMETELRDLNAEINTIMSRTRNVFTKFNLAPTQNSPTEEDKLAFIQSRLDALKTLEESHTQNLKVVTFLGEIQQVLNEHSDFPKQEIDELVKFSGRVEASKELSGFTWLLDFLNEHEANYKFLALTSDRTKRELLSAAISTKIDGLGTILDQDLSKRLPLTKENLEKYAQTIRTNDARIEALTSPIRALSTEIFLAQSQVGALKTEHEKLEQQLELQHLQLQLEQLKQEELRLDQQLQEQFKQGQQNLVVTLKKALDIYQSERDARYSAKDAFTTSDKNERAQFITELKIQLDAYVESNDSKVVIDYINANMSRFPGVDLQSTLNKVAITLIDFVDADKKTSYQSDKEVDAILAAHKANEKGQVFAAGIDELYKTIESMRDFGLELTNEQEQKVITGLADKLTQDVDHFVRLHEGALPNQQACQDFKTKFKTRLHSEDSLMSKYEHRWLVIIANIIAALTGIGAALLVHSKVTTGATPLFFSKTRKQEMTEKVEKALDCPRIGPEKASKIVEEVEEDESRLSEEQGQAGKGSAPAA